MRVEVVAYDVLESGLQYVRVIVEPAIEILVVCAHFPPLDDVAVTALARDLRLAWASERFAFLREARTGWARVSWSRTTERDLAAAAVAIVMASASWDESSPIIIEIDAHAFEVVAAYDGEYWNASVAQRTAP